jgi:hypothetical protein
VPAKWCEVPQSLLSDASQTRFAATVQLSQAESRMVSASKARQGLVGSHGVEIGNDRRRPASPGDNPRLSLFCLTAVVPETHPDSRLPIDGSRGTPKGRFGGMSVDGGSADAPPGGVSCGCSGRHV